MNNNPQNIRFTTIVHYIFILFCNGLQFIRRQRKTQIFIAILCSVFLIPWLNPAILSHDMSTPLLTSIVHGLIHIVTPLILYAFLAFIVIFLGMPQKTFQINSSIRQAGLKNDIGESPLLISKSVSSDNASVMIMEFLSLGVTPADVVAIQGNIEAALNMYIYKTETRDCLNRLLMHVVPVRESLPALLPLGYEHMSKEEFVLALGEDITRQQMKWNLDIQPHGIIAGNSGSGKTELTKTVAAQCAMKNAEVFILDRKGGIDFMADFWRQNLPVWVCLFFDVVQEQL